MASESEMDLCSLHVEKLKLFCMKHQEPVCVVCRDSKEHTNHRFRPVNEASQDYKQELRNFMKPLQEKLKLFQQAKGKCDEAAEHIKVQVQQTEKQIKEHFQKLRQFLNDEEEARISAVQEEEKQKATLIKQTTDNLSREIAYLSEMIKVTEEDLSAADVSFLRNFKASKERVLQFPLQEDPQPVSGALIDEAKHLSNLSYNIWSKMKKMKELVSYSPVVLDPNTAHPNIILSGDLTDVRLGQKQNLPENPERFDQHLCVLGSEGFNSGTHSWDVEVRSDRYWGVGVVKESVVRKGHIQTGYWELALLEGKFTAKAPPLPDKVLQVTNLQRVRVQLDWNKGRLFFFDLDSKRLIHTFKQTFTEKMIPYFGLHGDQSLKILPMNISVTEQHETPLTAGFWGS
ncbi:E3 ubiquitin-protein ligase TRIM39-like [Kryptolebias marmoratus]|uniref:E3 ubiquitin-protein ligase TRIM39-like n=1 Tax=Kryptolebias marmoratus TaxID=37003 RepID=UPI0007F8E131|nr:E3 ubiquitin-protein ligase TRIM39-like [Kryptolebias marmoratus]